MSVVRPVEYADASPAVRAVYDDILATRGIVEVPNFWKTIASDPPTLARLWQSLKQVMAPGALDARTKEMIAVAVSATNGCGYCVRSHTAQARKHGMTDAMLAELLAVTALFNETNRLVFGYQVELDEGLKG